MAEQSNYDLEDLARYRPAAVAAQFYQEKNESAAKGALEKLVSTLDIGKDGPVFVKKIRDGKEGDKVLASIFAPEYEKVLMSAKINDLFNLYAGYFKEYITGDSYEEVVKVFEEYGDENYKDMLDKYVEAQETLDSKRPNITEDEKKKAGETLMKYGKIVIPIQSFEGLEIEKISGPIKKSALRNDLTDMFKPRKSEGE